MKTSAGILFYKYFDNELKVFLVHPGGPYWNNKDLYSWSIPKGEIEPEESPKAAALREVMEETGILAGGDLIPLSPLKQKSGKVIYAWASEQDIEASRIASNSFELEWPPKSGQLKSFPEIDKADWFSIVTAKEKIHPGQLAWIDELVGILPVL